MLSLTACGSIPATQLQGFDPALAEDCPVPTIQGDTNQALAEVAKARKDALLLCNADKAALRGWLSTIKKE